MNKSLFVCFYLFCFLFTGNAQTGPAGVGSPANNVLWLKADIGPSSGTSGTPISFWNDQSGNGIHVTQTVSAQQPSFVTNVINGQPAVLFDNVNSSNQNDKLIGPDSPLLDNTSGYTFFYVTRPLNTGDARVIISKRTAVSINQSFMLFYYTSSLLFVDIQTTNDRFSSNTTHLINTNYLGTLIYNGAVATPSLRCTLYNAESFDRNATETSTLVPDNASPLLIGTTDATDPRPFGGYIAEIVVYREALNEASRIIVNNYLSAKYNITLGANDKYAGDNAGNGNYDYEVAGIGREATGSNVSFSSSVSGGLSILANSGLDNGDYVLAGHASPSNTVITTDVTGITGVNRARWQRIWYVDVTNTGAPVNMNVEFDMSDAGMGTVIPGALSDYVLLYRAGQSGNWTEVGTASSITGDRVAFNNISGLADGYITLGTRNFNASPLPVELLTFTAVPVSQAIELNWTTASERNNHYFSLEKSDNGEIFKTFATVIAGENQTTEKSYSYTDKNPYEQISYYRLKQTDYDGKYSYSPIVSVNRGHDGETLLVFPNPNSGIFKIYIPDAQFPEIRVSVTDALGKQAKPDFLVSSDAEGFFNVIHLSDLVPGTYTISVFTGHKRYNHKLIIK